MTRGQKSIKTKAFMISNVFDISHIIGVSSIIFLAVVSILLTHYYPELSAYLIVLCPYAILLTIIFLQILASFAKIVIESDAVTVKWLDITLKKIPVMNIKLFCAVGVERENVLCLSCYTTAELAELQEKRLLKNPLEKYNVPLRKSRGDWQDVFAREYLNYLRGNSLRLFRDPNIIMIEMKPALQYVIHQMHPQFTYKNYAKVTLNYPSQYSYTRGNNGVRGIFGALIFDYKVDLELDGIHIFAGNKEKTFIPAVEIKTAVRVDTFWKYQNYRPHHMPLLLITSLSEEELARRSVNSRFVSDYSLEKDNQALLAMIAATDMTMRWTIKKKDSCIMHHTQQNVEKLRELYPHIQFNEIAAGWITDSPE